MTIPTPVLFGNFDEASGNRADSIGSNTFIDNATVTSTTGLQGLAAQFTAANSEYFSIADNATVSAGAGSLAIHCHVQFDTLANMGIAGQFGPAGQYAYLLYLDHGGSPADRLHFYVSVDGTALVEVGALTFGAVTTGVWYDVCAWFDVTAGTISICINNGTVDSTSFTGPIFDSTASFYVGRWSSGEYMDGRIDLLGLWKAGSGPPLSSDDRTALYAAGAGVAYPFPADAPLYTEGSGFTILNRGTSIEPALEEWTETDHRIKFVAGRGDGVITGCQVTAPSSGFYVDVQAGQIQVTATLATLAACAVIPAPSDTSAPRIDVLVAEILGSGAAHVYFVQGTAAHHPRPEPLPVDTVGLAFVWIGPNLNVITSDCVVDKRCYVL